MRPVILLLLVLEACSDPTTPEDVTEPPAEDTQLVEHLVADGFNYPFGIAVADIDGNGKLDITVPDVWALGYQDWRAALYWYAPTTDPDVWTRHLIAEGEGFFERHALGDINGDGRVDLVLGDNIHGGVYWFENTGDSPWEKHTIIANLEGNSGDYVRRISAVALADFDKDGWLDVAVGGYNEGLVVLLENPGPSGEWAQYNIEAKWATTRMMRTGDIDRDGWPDVVASTQGIPDGTISHVAWFRNPAGRFPESTWGSIIRDDERRWEKSAIDDHTRAPGYGNLRDMDADGDLDVVIAFGQRDNLAPPTDHHVAWYENTAGAWTRHYVGALASALDADAGDFDGDGDLEIVAASHDGGNRVRVFDRQGDAWVAADIKTGWTAVNTVLAGDIDGDGDADILAAADDGNGGPRKPGGREVRWWRQERP